MSNNLNKSFCIQPWIGSYTGAKYDKKLCCISQEIKDMEKTPLKKFWNSTRIKEIRVDMLNGKRVQECEACYKNEDVNLPSMRTICLKDPEGNDMFDKYYKKFSELTYEDGTTDAVPIYFDYRTLSCNLQCISCGPYHSSRHNKLDKKMGRNENYFISDQEFEKSMSQEIITSLQNKVCTNLYWAGGEPFISKVHWDVIDEIKRLSSIKEYEEYIHQIHTHYNTNMTKLYWKGKSIPQMLEFFQPSIQASIDGSHETLEYLRDGAKWEIVQTNWKEYYKYLNKYKQIGIAPVLSAPMLIDIDRFIDFFEQYDITIYSHRLMVDPEKYPNSTDGFLDISLFPSYIAHRVLDNAIDKLSKTSFKNVESTINIIKQYKIEVDESNFTDKIIRQIKTQTLERDKFLASGRGFGDLLKIIDKDAFEWYDAIVPEKII